MKERTCKKHGVLTSNDVYIHKRIGRIDYDCKHCVAERCKRRNSERSAAFRRRYRTDASIREKRSLDGKIWYQKNSDTIIAHRTELHRVSKLECLQYYGGNPPSCAFCSESDSRFLALDHVKDDGISHRKTFRGSACVWARRNDFPPIFQILCHNCNFLKAIVGKEGKSNSARSLLNLKTEVMTHYSAGPPKCAMCVVSDIRILTIDHMSGGGASHRRSLGWKKLNRWLKHEGYPEGFQVLCFNHNLGKHCLNV